MVNIALIYERKLMYEKAIEYLEKALTVDPANSKIK